MRSIISTGIVKYEKYFIHHNFKCVLCELSLAFLDLFIWLKVVTCPALSYYGDPVLQPNLQICRKDYSKKR